VLVSVSSVIVGLLFGLVAGFFRRLDAPIMRLMDGIMAIPGLLLAIAMVALGGAQISTMVLAIAIPEVPRVVRLVRSIVLSVREEPYVEAAIIAGHATCRADGAPHPAQHHRAADRAGHLHRAAAILVEAILSFLGIGIPPEVPSLGQHHGRGPQRLPRAPAQHPLSPASSLRS
jgi:peptide/nickel transport system permease protein